MACRLMQLQWMKCIAFFIASAALTLMYATWVIENSMEKSRERNVPFYVGAKTVGRLGNHLFEAASSYGIAKRRNARWCLQDTKMLEEAVVWLERPKTCPIGVESFNQLRDYNKHGVYLPSMVESFPSSDIFVGDALQSFKYFTHVPFKLRTEAWGAKWVRNRKIDVGIHIRRGDYLYDSYHKGLQPHIEYYAAAIAYLKNQTSKDLKFVVTSDDQQWVREQEIFKGMEITDASPAEDMSILAACPHMILSVGTFSWWAAFFSRDSGIKIFYSERNKEIDAGSRSFEDFYPSGWVGMDLKMISRYQS